ncbi:MAG: energy transducer TonB, partial [Pseudomonadales bacterium]
MTTADPSTTLATTLAATTADKLSFTLFLTMALHAALIMGVTFTFVSSKPASHSMEVTLAQAPSDQAPDQADYLAQLNQAGSGTLEEKALLTAPEQAEFQDTQVRETAEPMQLTQASQQPEQPLAPVATTASQDKQAAV